MKRTTEGGVYICPAHVVLKHELPSGVFGEVKPAQTTTTKEKLTHTGTGRTAASLTEVHLLKASKAVWGAAGRLHIGTGDCVGQTPKVRTFTERLRPLRDV